MEDVNGFRHSAFNTAVRDWNHSLYPFPLFMYKYKCLSDPYSALTLDYRQPLYSISLPSSTTIKQKGTFNCTVIWTEYYIGDIDAFEDKDFNWITPYQNGRFVPYQKQLLLVRERGREVNEGDVISAKASLDEQLSFTLSVHLYTCLLSTKIINKLKLS